MTPLVIILQRLINNQDNFEQHLSNTRNCLPPKKLRREIQYVYDRLIHPNFL